jgi:hypothetical protein
VKSLYSCEELRSQFRDPPARWRRAEEFVIEEYGLVEDHGSWHDARAEDDEPIEIKSCAYEYADGSVGQFAIWEYQWKRLLCTGRLALLVYVPDHTCKVLAVELLLPHRIASAGEVYEFHHGSMGKRRLRRVPWTEVIPLDAVAFGTRHHFVDHYSEEIVEETLFMHPPDG